MKTRMKILVTVIIVVIAIFILGIIVNVIRNNLIMKKLFQTRKWKLLRLRWRRVRTMS